MNVLYKYCDQMGIVKILASLELKLPFIIDVNDPLECLPYYYCPNDIDAIRNKCLSVLKRKNLPLPSDFEQKLNKQFQKGEIQQLLVDASKKDQDEWNRNKGCLLSVSKNKKETVMWAHYAERHKGAIIGIDFDNIFRDIGVKMNPVEYKKERPKINVLDEPEDSGLFEAVEKATLTKWESWGYEEEFRTIFGVDIEEAISLQELQKQGLASCKDFKEKKTWFLCLHPGSIKEVIFGLYTEDGLKTTIKKLLDRPELRHVQLFQVKESETYKFDLEPVQ